MSLSSGRHPRAPDGAALCSAFGRTIACARGFLKLGCDAGGACGREGASFPLRLRCRGSCLGGRALRSGSASASEPRPQMPRLRDRLSGTPARSLLSGGLRLLSLGCAASARLRRRVASAPVASSSAAPRQPSSLPSTTDPPPGRGQRSLGSLTVPARLPDPRGSPRPSLLGRLLLLSRARSLPRLPLRSRSVDVRARDLALGSSAAPDLSAPSPLEAQVDSSCRVSCSFRAQLGVARSREPYPSRDHISLHDLLFTASLVPRGERLLGGAPGCRKLEHDAAA